MPRPDFPRTIFEFQQWFPDEESCIKFLIQSRWPDGFVCPRCGYNAAYQVGTRDLFQCKNCKHQVSVTAGTVMHRSRMPLRLWFHAAYLVSTPTPGMSALQFQRQTGITNYETAFTMLHKLRAAMVREGRTPLQGLVEVDESYIGGPEPGTTGRGAKNKVLVVGAVDLINDKYPSRVRLKIVPDASGASLVGFIKANIALGSTIITDDWVGYSQLKKSGYNQIIDVDHLTHVHRVFSNLKTWLLGTHHGAVRPQHLQAYLNEYVFRFNRRGTPMAAFQTVLGLARQRVGPTYRGLYDIKKGQSSWVHPSNPVKGHCDSDNSELNR